MILIGESYGSVDATQFRLRIVPVREDYGGRPLVCVLTPRTSVEHPRIRGS